MLAFAFVSKIPAIAWSWSVREFYPKLEWVIAVERNTVAEVVSVHKVLEFETTSREM